MLFSAGDALSPGGGSSCSLQTTQKQNVDKTVGRTCKCGDYCDQSPTFKCPPSAPVSPTKNKMHIKVQDVIFDACYTCMYISFAIPKNIPVVSK